MDNTNTTEMNQNEDVIVIDIGKLIVGLYTYVLRFWWLVLGCMLAGILLVHLVYTVTFRPMYRSSTTFTVSVGSETGNSAYYYSQNTADQMSKTFPYILGSHYFKSLLMDDLGRDTINGNLSASTLTDSNMVTMTMTSPDADDAYLFLKSAMELYPVAAHFILGQVQFNIIEEAVVPEKPYNHLSLKRQVAYGGAGGLFVICVIFLLLVFFDKKVSSEETLKPYSNMKCLSYTPEMRTVAHMSRKERRILVDDPRADREYRNAISTLAMRLRRDMNKDGSKTILLTSTRKGEGTTTMAVNLALYIAEKGRKVLLIDGDLRGDSGCGKLLGIPAVPGIQRIYEGEKSGNKVLTSTGRKNMTLLSGGVTADVSSAAMFSNHNFRLWMSHIKEHYDYIIIDTPACTQYQDAQLLTEYADGILYLIEFDAISINQLRQGLNLMDNGSAKMLGYAFNRCPEGMGDYGYGKYGYGKYGYGKYGYGKYGYGKYGYGKKYGYHYGYGYGDADDSDKK